MPLHQAKDLPLFAAQFKGKPGETCGNIPATQDGWHFVLPGNSTDFVKVTVTFEPGGKQEVVVFGPPSEKHAYVGSAPGAKLTAASAEVKGGSVDRFILSHTCPSTATASPSPSQSSPTTKPSSSPSASVSASAGTSASPSASVSASASPSSSVSASPSGSASSPVASPSVSASASAGGGLASTGSDAPVGLIAAMAGVMVAAGAVLVVRRRKAGAEG
ncbi:LPXTG cell wall anchor domain-containing protein [Streptomyces sp. NPDC007369]|uniref:LPXTG cell wall anchor domain-containing protein n=1 Tax=Streptomyces sp. NPDC007369 TaxID=3154589 RepID=UPI0033F74F02